MSEGQFYTAVRSDKLFEKRSVVRYSLDDDRNLEKRCNRVFIPFSGFDGQALAGSGALVFEGELLQSTH